MASVGRPLALVSLLVQSVGYHLRSSLQSENFRYILVPPVKGRLPDLSVSSFASYNCFDRFIIMMLDFASM